MFTYGANLHNRSILIWRVFNSNMAILRPYIEDEAINKLNSEFASMRTSDDFKKITSQLDSLSANSGVKVWPYK
jgi:hypothetical protein